MPIDRATLGPVEILVVAFQGNKFTGDILAALRQLVEGDVIHVLDLALVKKDLNGTVTTLKAGELEGDELETLDSFADEELVPDASLTEAANALEPGNSAAILVWEDRWAAKLINAIYAANGEVVSLELVPPEAIDELLDALQAG